MTIAQLSQFNPENSDRLLYGDPEIFRAMDMAASNTLINELSKSGLELTTDADAMAELRTRLELPSELGIAITAIRTADAATAMPDGAAFLADTPEAMGYCFSAGIEQDGKEVLDLFVAIDASRYPEGDDTDEPTDEQVEAVLELNHYLITQLLIGLDGDDTDEEPSDEVFAALEEKAHDLMEAMIDAGIPPMLAVIPTDGVDED
ncbi:hypothetical protein HJC99_04335 [Candidatus Saccharibacteria bacterium]|nr:hypothetical protein [Candidatus Saccharibacteria bacterium]